MNENDTIATDEIRFGDNDRLAAQVAVTIGADQLVLLSDVDGLYTANPNLKSKAKFCTSFLGPKLKTPSDAPSTTLLRAQMGFQSTY